MRYKVKIKKSKVKTRQLAGSLIPSKKNKASIIKKSSCELPVVRCPLRLPLKISVILFTP